MRTAYIHANIPFSKADAFITENGRFREVGKARRLLKRPLDRVVDLREAVVLPGFHDAHLHLLGIGKMEEIFDASRHTSIAALVEALRKEEKDPLLGRGYHEDGFKEKRPLLKTDLDKAARDRPIAIYRACGHLVVANEKAIEEAKKHHGRLPKKASAFDLEKGHFKEEAISWILFRMENPSKETIKRQILLAQDKLLSQGVTAVQSDDFAVYETPYETVLDAFRELAAADQLTIRIQEQVHPKDLEEFDRFLEKDLDTSFGRYKRGPLKLFLDGSLGARTALLRSPYADDPQEKGLKNFTDEELYAFAKRAAESDMDFAFHAIGDAAIEQALALSERLEAESVPKGRDALIHAQVADEELILRMKRQRLGAIVQPIFIRTDHAFVHERLGERAKKAYLFNTMREKGLMTAISTDAPVEPSNPFLNLYTACTRKTLRDLRRRPYLKKEALPLKDALKAYTETPAYFARSEGNLGRIAPGYEADFIVVSGFDTHNVKSLRTVRVKETYIAGERVYQA